MVKEILEKYPYVSVHDHPTFFPKTMGTARDINDAMRAGRQFCSCLLYTSSARESGSRGPWP